MIYRLVNHLHTLATRRMVTRLARGLDELTGGDRDQKIAYHAGELATLMEVDATDNGRVLASVVITVDDEGDGYHVHTEYVDEEVET